MCHPCCRWRSSLWKLVWKQLAVYLLAYLAISLLYRFVLTGLSPAQQSFEKVATRLLLAKSLDTLTLLTCADTADTLLTPSDIG